MSQFIRDRSDFGSEIQANSNRQTIPFHLKFHFISGVARVTRRPQTSSAADPKETQKTSRRRRRRRSLVFTVSAGLVTGSTRGCGSWLAVARRREANATPQQSRPRVTSRQLSRPLPSAICPSPATAAAGADGLLSPCACMGRVQSVHIILISGDFSHHSRSGFYSSQTRTRFYVLLSEAATPLFLQMAGTRRVSRGISGRVTVGTPSGELSGVGVELGARIAGS